MLLTLQCVLIDIPFSSFNILISFLNISKNCSILLSERYNQLDELNSYLIGWYTKSIDFNKFFMQLWTSFNDLSISLDVVLSL